MRKAILIAPLLVLAAGCNEPSQPDAAGADTDAAEASREGAEAAGKSTAAADYEVPEDEPELFWFVTTDPGSTSAVYGPQNAGGFVILGCAGGKVDVTLQEVDGLQGRETATMKSGPVTGEFKTSYDGDGMGLLSFEVPLDHKLLGRIARDGFYVSFPNGEENPFPPSGKLDLLLKACR